MIPGHTLSSQVVAAQFRYPRNVPKQVLTSYEYGGVGLNDPSRGLRDRVWKGEYVDGDIVISAENVDPVVVLSVDGIVDFDFTFDQNMRVAVAYELTNGDCRFYWFDGTIPGFTTLSLASGTISPKCAIDDNRDMQIGVSDIILAYVRAGTLYFREQRDRYTVERSLKTGVGSARLLQIGMNEQLRFQFHLSTAVEQLDSPSSSP